MANPKITLDELLKKVDPKVMEEKITKKHAQVRHDFKIPKLKVDNYEDFKSQIIKYVQYHTKMMYGTKMPEHLAFANAQAILEDAFKDEGGINSAFDQARKPGGLRKIIDTLSESFHQRELGSYTEHILSKVDPQDFEHHTELMRQYKEAHKQMLPHGMKTKSAKELAQHWKPLIQNYFNERKAKVKLLKKYKPNK